MDNRSLSDHFGNFSPICAERNSLFPISSDTVAMQKQRDQLDVLQFLATLPPDYEPFRSQIIAGSELPSLDEVYSRALRFSTYHPSASVLPIADRSALASQRTSTPGGRGGPPDNQGNRASRGNGQGSCGNNRGIRSNQGGRGRGRGHGDEKCDYCGRPNHTRATCWDLHGRPPRHANAASSAPVDPPSNTVTLSGEDYEKFLQYQSAQQAHHPVASLAQSGKRPTCLLSTSNPWILDSGASDHMSGNPKVFSHLRFSHSLPYVTLADGSQTKV